MKRLAAIVCGTTLAVAALAGCGSDDGDDSNNAGGSSSGGDYCSQVEDMEGGFDTLSGGDATVEDMRSAVDQVGTIADSAPSDVSSEWESVHSAMDDMVTKFEDSGMATDKPIGEAATELAKKNRKKAMELSSATSQMQSVQSDGEAISKQIKDECGFELGSDSEK